MKPDIGRRIELSMEHDVVMSLLAGNDTQCFSLEQYVTARDKWIANIAGMTREDLGITDSENDRYWTLEYARRQLRACPFVDEVKPDVWILRDAADAAGKDGEL